MMRRCSSIPTWIVLALLGTPAQAASGGSSWQVRSEQQGSGRWVVSPDASTFCILGDFEGSREWVSDDGGVTGTIRADGPPFPADSVASFSIASYSAWQFAVTLDGKLWLGTSGGREWHRLSCPDSVGVLTCAAATGRFTTLVGTQGGEIFASEIDCCWDGHWTRIADLGDAPVRSIGLREADQAIVLLEDGGLLAQDTAWVAAPFAASHFRMDGLEDGYAIERDSLRLWRTEDGGLSWSPVSDALASEELAPWARQARGMAIRSNSFGVLSCGDALLATDDGGVTWRVSSEGTGMFLDAAIDERGVLMTAGARIHRSTDGARSVVQTMGSDFSRVLMGSAGTYWAIDLGLLLSVQRGEVWIRQPLPDRAGRLRRIAVRGDYEIWLHFDGQAGSRLFHSRDRGGTYEEFDPEGTLHGARWWSFDGTGTAWAYTDSTVLRSVDGGESWTVVHDGLPEISAIATLDSLRAVVASAGRFSITSNGGREWTEVDPPSSSRYTALSFAGSDSLVALARGLTLLPAEPPWGTTYEVVFADTLRAVRMSDDGIGWAVGDNALIVQTSDRGQTWLPYEIDLEMNSLETPLVSVHSLGTTHAVTGGPLKLLRMLPDVAGPIFRYGVSMNPQLPRYVDVHVTARERLLGDSLSVTIDAVPVPALLFDPDGFLYRVHYRIPSFSDELYMRTRASDWLGNPRTDGRTLLGFALDSAGETAARWAGEEMLLKGQPGAFIAVLEMGCEVPDPPPEWECVGAPFQIATDGEVVVSVTRANVLVARFSGDGWRILDEERSSVPDGSIVRLVRDPYRQPPAPEDDLLRVFPLPAAGTLSLAWFGPAHAPLRWSLFDIGGRLVSSGAVPAASARLSSLRTVDRDGRLLASGIYWLIAEEEGLRTARRVVVVR